MLKIVSRIKMSYIMACSGKKNTECIVHPLRQQVCYLTLGRHHELLLASGVSALGQPHVVVSMLLLLLSIHL